MNQHLRQFAQQLSTWTEDLIAKGRIPFRRVDTFPTIHTAAGPQEVPLIFWINRQSMMAGGVVLLPNDNLENELKIGRDCAEALGLQHFVTWEKDQVRIWRSDTGSASVTQIFPLKNPEHPETFRFFLEDLLDALKLTAVLGSIPMHELSANYFHNLCQITLQQTLPSMIEAYRSRRAEDIDDSTEDVDYLAEEANRQILLQILALLWFEKMPEKILPEKMDRALELSIPLLPEPLPQILTLNAISSPPALPLESAVAFHHFLLRLRQLSWVKSPERIKKCFLEFSRNWYPKPLEIPPGSSAFLYPSAPPNGEMAELILSDSPSLLALITLVKCLQKQQTGSLIFGNLFKLDQQLLPTKLIHARLFNKRAVTSVERSEFVTQLRTSWPHRRFKIKTGQPIWIWELIHLLGICRTGQRLSLEFPPEGLRTAANELIWNLLFENFRFNEIYQSKDRLRLVITREQTAQDTILVHLESETREFLPAPQLYCFRSQLLLALSLPKDIYQLLEHELIWPAGDLRISTETESLRLYRQSNFYQLLRYLTRTEFFHALKSPVAVELEPNCVPQPTQRLLKQLSDEMHIHALDVSPPSINQLLAEVLSCPAIAMIEPPNNQHLPQEAVAKAITKHQLKEFILNSLTTFGIPKFPEQYLYFLEQPEMRQYNFTPPVKINSEFLGQFTLEDAQRRIIEGYGEELKQALLFCSQSGKTRIDLPQDRRQINQILNYYRKDLRALREYLKNLCYSQIEDSKEARRMINNLWKQLGLPDPSWLKD